jgi:hypothetical protein
MLGAAPFIGAAKPLSQGLHSPCGPFLLCDEARAGFQAPPARNSTVRFKLSIFDVRETLDVGQAGYQAPPPRITAGKVRSRIRKYSRGVRVRTSSRSMELRCGNRMALRP